MSPRTRTARAGDRTGSNRRKSSRGGKPWNCRRPHDCLLQQAVAGLSIGFLLIDPQGRLVWINRAAENVLGISAQEATGKALRRVLRDPRLAQFWSESACHEGNCMADVSLRWPRPTDLKMNATRCVAPDGREIGRAILFCDVTSDHTVVLKLSRDVASRFMDLTGPSTEPPPAVGQLTAQELRTLRLVGRGLANEAIARELSVALSTVRSHVKSVYRKLGLHNRAAAASLAARHHLL